MKEIKYSITVYEDHAIIQGRLDTDILFALIQLMRQEGFTHLTHTDDIEGFKLVKKEKI